MVNTCSLQPRTHSIKKLSPCSAPASAGESGWSQKRGTKVQLNQLFQAVHTETAESILLRVPRIEFSHLWHILAFHSLDNLGIHILHPKPHPSTQSHIPPPTPPIHPGSIGVLRSVSKTWWNGGVPAGPPLSGRSLARRSPCLGALWGALASTAWSASSKSQKKFDRITPTSACRKRI